MFTQYLKNFDKVLVEAKKSEKIIKKEFLPIYNIVEDYVKKNNLILSNVETLINQENITYRSYIIYGDNIFKHANNIANNIAKITIYVIMYTSVKNQEFSISVNGTSLIQLFNIQNRLREVISPVEFNGIFLYPPEFELIEIHHKLYRPNYAEEWGELETIRDKLYKKLYERKTIIGGKYNREKRDANNQNSKKVLDNKIIFNWLKGRTDYIIIGINAINILTESSKYYQKIQLVIDSPIEKFAKEFNNLIFQFVGYQVTYKTHNPNIPIEPRLQKTVISISIPSKDKGIRVIHLMDVFNSAQYELVPYTTYKDLNIGYPNVLSAFVLVDLWFIRILYALKIINSQTLKQSIGIIFECLENIKKIDSTSYTRELYMGIYNSLDRHKKKQSLQNTFYPYVPEQHRYQKGNYRII